MIIVMGYIGLPAAEQDKAMEAISALVSATRQEVGCISYSFARDLLDPDIVRISEEWASEDALKAHGQQPHMAEFGKVAATLGITARALNRYVAGDGVPI
ncbi:putative quinol monooxygenase [Altererythrobacter aquiaggeris]|uniref:putative quinol monooxygenase n=1 Tax=Aestuarierythrobacter aquiaggeris TaxID=1898396 RepID=UPI003017CDCF